jgi:hypothetical protein
MQTVDESAISGLSLAAEFAHFIATKQKGKPMAKNLDTSTMSQKTIDGGGKIIDSKIGGGGITRSLPKFLWLLRDFVLELKENGRAITENEYLENRLTNFAKSKNQRNKRVREALHKAFLNRELLTMVRPVEDDSKINTLEKLEYSQLREPFRVKVEVLRHKVFREGPLKLINNRPITGPMLALLIEKYVESLNKGTLPDVSSA